MVSYPTLLPPEVRKHIHYLFTYKVELGFFSNHLVNPDGTHCVPNTALNPSHRNANCFISTRNLYAATAPYPCPHWPLTPSSCVCFKERGCIYIALEADPHLFVINTCQIEKFSKAIYEAPNFLGEPCRTL